MKKHILRNTMTDIKKNDFEKRHIENTYVDNTHERKHI